MKIKRSQLQKIVREETIRHLVGLMEAGEHGVVDADEDNKQKDGERDKKDRKSDSPNQSKKPSNEPKELPVDDEPADDELEDDEDVTTPEEDLEADSNGHGIGDQIAGKTILSFTVEPKPVTGKSEIVLQFKADPAPLRIIVMPNGELMFAYKGAMSKSLSGEEA